ncbi:MAG: Wzz/FepE/Etk N-terminal domain-containing protein [Bacteroidales bacterium]|nr:Wzz/FepE/Etk N-terminal domain-containing protein [Bacteroidales bacterium]
MKKNIRAEFKPDSVDLMNFFIRHIRKFVIAGLVAGVLSAIISLLIKPLYESTVTLYPSSNITEARTVLGEVTSKTALFGDDDATEKLIQVINSEQVREYLKGTWDLAGHDRIKPGERYPNTVIAEKMDRYIRCSKTPYGSVEIKVRDRDREMACALANDMASRADTIFNNLQRNAARVMLDEISRSYELQDHLVRQYEDTLSSLQGAAALKIYSTLETENDYLGLIRGRYLEALALSQQTMPYTLVVDRAVVAEKKVYPRRSLIVIVSTASFIIVLALTLFVVDGVKLHPADDRQ